MSEDGNNKPDGNTEVKTYTKEEWDTKQNNFVTQIKDLTGTVKQFQEQDAARKATNDTEESERLKNNEEFKTLIAKLELDAETKAKEYKQSNDDLTAKFTGIQQDKAILESGIKDELTILGLKAKYQSTEDAGDFGEWLKSQNLKPVTNPVSSGSVGTINTDNVSLDERLKSTDKTIKLEALREQLQNQA